MSIGAHPHAGTDAVTEVPAHATSGVSAPPPEARLRMRDAGGVAWRAVRRAQKDHAANLAQAVAFNLFLAIPSAALVVVGVFASVASEGTAGRLLEHLNRIVPASVVTLLNHSLTRMTHNGNGGTAMIVVGAVLAVWSLTGAMQTLQWALNIAHDLEEKRGFVH